MLAYSILVHRAEFIYFTLNIQLSDRQKEISIIIHHVSMLEVGT